MGLVFYIFYTGLLLPLYILPVLLIRFLLGRPINRGSALALSFIAFIAYTIVHLMLWKVAHKPPSNIDIFPVLVATVLSYFIVRKGASATNSTSKESKEPKPMSSADKTQKASPSRREAAKTGWLEEQVWPEEVMQLKKEPTKTPTTNPIKKQKDKAPYKPKEIPMNSAHDDEKFYEQVATELQEGNTRQGLWLKAETKAGGDKEQARLLYVEWRVEQLTKEADKANQAKAWNELIEAEAQARGERDLEEERITKEAEAQNYKEQQAEQIDSTCEKDRKPKSEKMLARGEGIIKSRMRLDLECEAERTVNVLLRLLNHGYIWKRKEHFIYNDVWSIKKESSVKWIDFFNIDELKEWADKNLPK
tara:strand:+ start:621 stop:1709 length:1089 start_codon:yes stop_codon:yes gene_type:complete